MRHTIQTTVMVLVTTMVALAAAGPVSAQTISGLQVPPPDSAEAWRVRMWVPQEGTSQCRMSINILNDSNRVVRHVIEFLAGPGYYNFYWDKLDDSGMKVPEGEYTYVAEYCETVHRGTVEVQYDKWEKISRVEPFDTAAPMAVTLVLEADSVPVTVRLLDRREIERFVMAEDTLLNKGRHVFDEDPGRLARGNYFIEIIVGDHEYRREVTYLP